METILGRHWHHLPADEVVALLETEASMAQTIAVNVFVFNELVRYHLIHRPARMNRKPEAQQ